MMLRQYAVEHGLTVIDEYIDDGWSGTNFDRSGWNEIIRLAEAGKVKTVIAKDMSRMGGDYLKVGYYTGSFFAERDIRYIVINDGVDSDPEQAAMMFICKRLQLNYKKLSEEEKKCLKKIAQKSDLLKNPNLQRGRK